jgi:membrane protease YdiL (CAAX protease family)
MSLTGWYRGVDGAWHQTDAAPAPGWWLASDRCWYPPAQATWRPDAPWMASRWGLGQLWWAALVFVAGSILFAVAYLLIDGALHPDRVVDETEFGPYATSLSIGLSELALGAVALFATRSKGLRSLRDDFGLRCRRRDVAIGFGLGVVALVVAGAASAFLDDLLGVDERTSNVPFDALHGWEILAYLLAVAVIAPVMEELLFRGLVYRSFLKRGSRPLAAGVWTTLIFVAPHLLAVLQWPGVVTLFVAIAVLGAVFNLACHWTGNRLGAPIVAHMVVNASAVIALAFG